MADEMDTIDRNSVLDAFAAAGEGEERGGLPAKMAFHSPEPERIVGAQQVAVLRDERRVLEKLKVLAAAAGSDWYYRFPVKKKDGGTDYIEGASIKLANDLARLYGNCEVDTRVQDLGESWLIYARFTDFETGYALVRPFQQRKSQRSMRGDADRALDIAFQIGVSKAIRNVVTNALQTFSDFAFDEAKQALVDKIGKNLANYRNRVLQGFENAKIDPARAEQLLGRASADWTAPDVAKVIAMMKAVADGMATWDETFPLPADAATKAVETKLDALAGADGQTDQAAETKKPEPEQKTADPKTNSNTKESAPSQAENASAIPEADANADATGRASETAEASDKPDASAAPNNNGEAILAARKRGVEAREKKMTRKATPPEFRTAGREDELEAWLAGFDTGSLEG